MLLVLMRINALSVDYLLFGVWCDVYFEGEFEAGWLASMWLADRLLRSAVVFASMKQYGHVLLIVV